MVTDADVIITRIIMASSGIGIQFYLHILGQGRNTVLALEQLLAALNVRPTIGLKINTFWSTSKC